jgi:hypothetical protein
MMNTDTLAQTVRAKYENAARKYCAKIGINPDSETAAFTEDGTPGVPAWHNVAYQLHDLSAQLVSLKEAAADAAPTIIMH